MRSACLELLSQRPGLTRAEQSEAFTLLQRMVRSLREDAAEDDRRA